MNEKMTSNRVTIEEMVAYFWKEGDITTKEKVNVDFHEDNLVDVSVMLRNEQEGVGTMVRICVEFDTVENFINILNITAVEQVHEIGLEAMFEFYRDGIAELDVLKEPVFLGEQIQNLV